MKKLFLAALLLVVPTTVRGQEPADEKAAAIRRLMEVTGAMNLGQQMSIAIVDQMAASLARVRPDLPDELLDDLSRIVNQVIDDHIGDLEELMIPIYDRHLSLREVEELSAFYETELGQRVIAVLPVILQESMAEGQRWGAALAPEIDARVIERLVEAGVIPPDPAEPN